MSHVALYHLLCPWMVFQWVITPLICRFMSGVRHLRRPVPKYPVFWNARNLLNYLVNWRIDPTSLREVSRKLATILACLSVQRVHTLSLIDCNVQFLDEATYLYVFHDLKVARSRPWFVITLPALRDADTLGAAQLLQTYLTLTKPVRSERRQLLLSFVQPHKPVTPDTIARWIRGVLADAGIDTSRFGAHSVRGASSSLAQSVAPLDEVLKAGDWSSLSTFHKHYRRRESLLPSPTVAKAIIQSASS